MTVIIGADHRGFALKEELKKWLIASHYIVVDKGAETYAKDDDYTRYAAAVTRDVLQDDEKRGIVICGSGVGVMMVANKIKGIRCGLGITKEQVIASRNDDDITVLAIAADYVTEDDAKEMVECFLSTPFSMEERHINRLKEIESLENI